MKERVSASASRDASGVVRVSLANVDPHETVDVDCRLRGLAVSRVDGQVLAADSMTAHNTFEAPDRVCPEAFRGASLEAGALRVSLPPASVVVVTLS